MEKSQLTYYLDQHRYQLELDPTKVFPWKIGEKVIRFFFDNTWKYEVEDQSGELVLDQAIDIPLTEETSFSCILHPKKEWQYYEIGAKKDILIGSMPGATIQLTGEVPNLLLRKDNKQRWQITLCEDQGVYLNNHYIEKVEKVLEKGDEISFSDWTIKIFPEEIFVTKGSVVHSKLAEMLHSRYTFYPDYPDFHRSPRLIYRNPEEKLQLNSLGAEKQSQTEGLVKLIVPPLAMVGVTVGMGFLRGNGFMVIATAATTVVTTIVSITNYINTRKKQKKEEAEKRKNYAEYLSQKALEFRKLAQEQYYGQHYHFPDVTEILQMSRNYHHRIYEKTPLHFDFLHYRLGLGSVKNSCEISYKKEEGQKITDELEQEAKRLNDYYETIDQMPITTNLTQGPLGYIGPRPFVIEQLQLLVNQLVFSHSYHDLQFVVIFPEEEKAQWEWMRWLPHATLQEMNVRGFVHNQRSRDQVLNSLNQILKNRKNALDENKGQRESTLFSPHYVVMITDEKLILDHVIMEFFNEDPSELGCSVIFVQEVMSSLSENVKNVIDIKDRYSGLLVMEDGQLKNTPFKLDHFPTDFDKEELPRILAPLNHLQNLKSSIPEAVTFLEMYNVEKFEELEVTKRWAEHSPHKSLAVPLGLRGKDDIVYLNLHEKAHGPHGLVAGTTGSGKSEIVQSYILSLAVNFHPYDVAFLLIDYKGGGMANLFRNLPHLLGTITNLDGAQSMRALISINAELKRRQRLFSENNVNHINQYQKLYKNGDVSEPMPHLFLISDEFAELKSEQPEFMDELISTARIGRSLGIHLILATQKPSGVVNDQIWSNSKFKLCLKVADRADSMEMLKTPDAAEITQPGRSYLQVGNNEIYELFQSAWSGADYQPNKDEQQIEDHTIYKINELGQYEILSEDLSGLDSAEDVQQVPTELDAIVDSIQALTQAEGIEPLPRPWLPPLEKRIFLTSLHPVNYQEAWQTDKQELAPTIGIVDIPSMQAQETQGLNLTQDGHIAVFASPTYGKSTFIQTLVMDLARVHNPERLHVYLIDFGTNGLLPLGKLPHVADTIGIDDEEKVGKFIRRMTAEVKRRKKLLSEYAVANVAMYEKASGEELPNIIVAVDSFDGLKGAKFEEAMNQLLVLLSREGLAIGIYLVISASQSSSMRSNLQGNLKTKIALKLNDDNSARDIVGRTQLSIEDTPGRGLIKLEEPASIQIALPTEGEDALQIIEAIQAEALEMSENWQGERPEPIPMVPEVLDFEEFKKKKEMLKVIQQANIPIGLDKEDVEPVSIELTKQTPYMIVGDKSWKIGKMKNQLSETFVLLENNIDFIVLDDDEQIFKDNSNSFAAYLNEREENLIQLREVAKLMEERKNALDVLKKTGENINKFIDNIHPMVLVISEIQTYINTISKEDETLLLTLLSEGPKVGIYSILTINFTSLTGLDPLSKFLKTQKNFLSLNRLGDVKNISLNGSFYNEPELDETEGYHCIDGTYMKIKLVTLFN